jgi:hypothetical protein
MCIQAVSFAVCKQGQIQPTHLPHSLFQVCVLATSLENTMQCEQLKAVLQSTADTLAWYAGKDTPGISTVNYNETSVIISQATAGKKQ